MKMYKLNENRRRDIVSNFHLHVYNLYILLIHL